LQKQWRLGLLALAMVAGASACASRAVIPKWDPAAFRDLDTLELLTVGPEEGKHWSTVWLVVIDDQVYVRLGSKAADRMRRNTTAPLVAVRIGGREYEPVRAEETAAMVARVGAAMGEKYWSDLLVRYVPHPLTVRLQPEAAP
jgi:hypothetical protein